MIIKFLYLLFSNYLPIIASGERIFIGIVGAGLIITFLAIRDSGITSKKGREHNRIQKKIDRIEHDLNELDNLYDQGILKRNEHIEKSIDLQKKRIDLIVEKKLIEDDDYASIVNAHKNGLLTDSQKNEKIDVIRNRIKRDLK